MPSIDHPSRVMTAVLALAMAPAIGVGIGRFAYALVLPDMQADFGWSYSQAGLPNAANAVGYLSGAFLARRAAARVGLLRLVVWSSVAAACATLLSAFVGDLATLCALRLVSGLAGAFGLVGGGACAVVFAERAGGRRSLAIALFYVGPPVGIVVSALVTPAALAIGGGASWRIAQAALGAASIALLVAFLPLSREQADHALARDPGERARLLPMAPLLAGYASYGAGSIAYMTFMIAFLRRNGVLPVEQAAFWCTLGTAGVASAWIWSHAFTRLKGGLGVAAATLVTAVGAAVPLFWTSASGMLASAVVFGLGIFASTAATTVFLERNLPRARRTSGISAMTVAFSLGQTAGPVISGAAIDASGGLAAGLMVGAALLGLGALLAGIQRDRPAA